MVKQQKGKSGPQSGMGKGITSKNIAFALTWGLFPMVAATGRALPALAIAISMLVVLLLTALVAAGLKKHLSGGLGKAATLVAAATFTVSVEMLLGAFWPAAYAQVRLSVIRVAACLLALPWVWDSVQEQDRASAALKDLAGKGFAVALAVALLGVVREFFASGTVFEVSVGNIALIPGLSTVPGGLMLVGILLGLSRVGKGNPEKNAGKTRKEA